MKRIVFNSMAEMVDWLIDNEGKHLADNYGRRWKYEKSGFYFKDIGGDSRYLYGIKCLHLYSTVLWILN